jgi:uncharacterized protein
MLFARRTPLSISRRARALVWPSGDVRRSARYVWLRTLRIGASPHRLALGLAIGVFVASTPLLGLQFMLAGVLAWMLRASLPAAMIGTFWANPITCPPIWLASYGIGAALLGLDPFVEGRGVPEALTRLGAMTLHMDRHAWPAMYDAVRPILQPVLLGSIPLGLAFASIVYVLVRHLTRRTAAPVQQDGLETVEPQLHWS